MYICHLTTSLLLQSSPNCLLAFSLLIILAIPRPSSSLNARERRLSSIPTPTQQHKTRQRTRPVPSVSEELPHTRFFPNSPAHSQAPITSTLANNANRRTLMSDFVDISKKSGRTFIPLSKPNYKHDSNSLLLLS